MYFAARWTRFIDLRAMLEGEQLIKKLFIIIEIYVISTRNSVMIAIKIFLLLVFRISQLFLT